MNPYPISLFLLRLNQLLLFRRKCRDFARDPIVVLALHRIVGDVKQTAAIMTPEGVQIVALNVDGTNVEGTTLRAGAAHVHMETRNRRGT
jgi:hypothetical protein